MTTEFHEEGYGPVHEVFEYDIGYGPSYVSTTTEYGPDGRVSVEYEEQGSDGGVWSIEDRYTWTCPTPASRSSRVPAVARPPATYRGVLEVTTSRAREAVPRIRPVR